MFNFFKKKPKVKRYQLLDPLEPITWPSFDQSGQYTPDTIAVYDQYIVDNFKEPEKQFSAFTLLSAHWLKSIEEKMNEKYQLFEHEHFLILYPENESDLDTLINYLESSRQRILTSLNKIACPIIEGKLPVLVCAHNDDYYHYVEQYYPEGEFNFSAGMFISGGISHFCMPHDDILILEPTIIHELTHAYVSHLPLPVWLNEGLAVNIEDSFYQTCRIPNARELIDKHRQYWNDDNIQKFWSGESFSDPEEGATRSYNLAKILTQAMSHNYDKFTAFVNQANAQDAGESACQNVFGGSLSLLLDDMLGPGNWTPKL